MCYTAYFEIQRIGPIRQLLTTKTLVVSLVLCRLHYYNALLAGISLKNL